MTAREIANRHKVSLRTVYRDIRALEQSGIPVAAEEGKGYSLNSSYRLPPIAFTEEQMLALTTAQELMTKNKDASLVKHYGEAMMKIKAVLPYSNKEQLELLSQRMLFRANDEELRTSNLVTELQMAITNYWVLTIDYISLEKARTTRKIEPFAIYSTQDNWLLIAYCRKRKAFRKFRVDCIERSNRLAENFEPHPMTLQEYFNKFG